MFKQFKESGHLMENFSANSEGDLIKDAELFSTGVHRGRNYTEEDLHSLANSFTPEENVPLQLDHSESVRDTVGFLEVVSVVGNKLMGKIRVVDEVIKEKIANKTAKKLSVSFYTDSKGNPTKLREVSIVAFPQVKSAQMFSEQPQLNDRKQALYEKAREFQIQMKFRELQMKMKATEIKLAQAQQKVAEEKAQVQAFREAREEAEYQSYMANLRGENTIKYTAEQDREYQEYLDSFN
ncbi:hypothetical protein [Bacillus wiedmannii]|uniref:hypothetical protein n=1 Tax=Bacillus wiedmannii TaxID=1890302 RepID=UPI000BF1788C|nr:hypothetical protein [Bacillus wiedmannii]PEL84514.1 hypothetical protein CN609_03585 [Bacillus wiedmannii]